MKLTALQIERFGTRSNLHLDDLSPALNVIYGPNGSGKSTISHFIRWMLYGSDDLATQRYRTATDTPLGGSLQLIDGHHRPRELRRFSDRLRGDQVQLRPDDLSTPLEWDARRLTSVTAEEYGHLFCFGFEQTPSIERLLELARARAIDPLDDARHAQRLRELTDRCNALRHEESLAPHHESLPALQQQRRQIHDELQSLERRHAERTRQWQHEADALAVEIETDRNHGESLQAMLRRTEAAIDARREQLDRLALQAGQVRRQWLDERRQEVAELDYQIKQWHNVLDSVRHRRQELAQRMGQQEPQPALSALAADHQLRLFLRSLGHQLEDIEQDWRDWSADVPGDERQEAEYLQSVLGAALSSMRADVHRLCRELQRQQSNALYHDQAREQDHLRRCEAELQQLIDSLHQRRQALVVAPEFTEQPWIDPSNGMKSAYNGKLAGRSWSDDPLGQESAASPAAAYYVADPVLEARRNHLIRRRDHLAARIAELATRIEQNEHRLAQLRGSHLPSDDQRRRDTLRSTLEDLDRRIWQAESSLRRRQEIESLERQIAELRAAAGPSELVREASALLHRLTDGSYVALRVAPSNELWVDDHRGHSQAYRELSRGARDQVYLSLALALVAAYRRRGIEMAMVLNDVFANIDNGRAQATAELLARFAAEGHQLILLTRYEHVMQRFAALPAKLYTLRERVEPPASPPPAWREPSVPPAGFYLDQAPPRALKAAWEQPVTPVVHAPPRAERPSDWVAHWEPLRRNAPTRSESDPFTEPSRGSLSVDAPLTDVDWLDRRYTSRLQDHGIRTVEQLLAADPEECQRHIDDPAVNAATVYRWQSQLSLQCFVGLTDNDAALLIACGVDDPEELSYIDVSQLHRRIEDHLADTEARHRFGSIARYERSRLARWIQTARRSHYRRPRMAEGPVRRPAHRTPPVIYRAEPTERLTPRARRVDAARMIVAAPADVPVQRASDPAPDELPQNETLRYFLEPSDLVVNAPSIGPKTAERLNVAGVMTVADLLQADPDDAAQRINYRRISSDLIRTWQRQANFVCRVPNLRGQDAQLLVACQIPGPEQLAKLEPDTLLAQITTLLGTAEGKRILRSTKAPQAQDITNWVRWSRHARDLAK